MVFMIVTRLTDNSMIFFLDRPFCTRNKCPLGRLELYRTASFGDNRLVCNLHIKKKKYIYIYIMWTGAPS